MAQHAEIEALLAVDRHDQEIARLDEERRYLERLLDKEREHVRAVEAKLEEARERARELHRRLDALDLETRTAAERRAKLQVQQNQAKTNDEYAALGRQIEALGREIAEREDATLAGYEEQEALEADIGELERALAEAREQLEHRRQALDKDMAAVRSRREEQQAARAAALEAVGPQTRALYERVLAKVGGRALAPVEDRMCRGCFVQLPTNLVAMVLAGKEIVRCPQCTRFLYAEGGRSAASHSYVAGGDRSSPMPGD